MKNSKYALKTISLVFLFLLPQILLAKISTGTECKYGNNDKSMTSIDRSLSKEKEHKIGTKSNDFQNWYFEKPDTVLKDNEDFNPEKFQNPPESTRPRCYWYWFDDHVSKEGITRDLEAMKSVGIGGAYIGLIGGAIGKRNELNPKPLSNPWWKNLLHAVREGTRLGVDLGLFNSPGWSQSGGPWVKPNQSMRYLVQEEIHLQGPQRFIGRGNASKRLLKLTI